MADDQPPAPTATQPQGITGDPLPPLPQPAAAPAPPSANPPGISGDPLPALAAAPTSMPQGITGDPLPPLPPATPRPSGMNGDVLPELTNKPADETTGAISHPAASDSMDWWHKLMDPQSFRDVTSHFGPGLVAGAITSAIQHPIDAAQVSLEKGNSAVANLESDVLSGYAGVRNLLAKMQDAHNQFTKATNGMFGPQWDPAIAAAGTPGEQAAEATTHRYATTAPDDTAAFKIGTALIDHWQETSQQKAKAIATYGAPINSTLDSIGQFAPYVALGYFTGGLGLAPTATLAGGGSQLRDAVENNATPNQKGVATGIGLLLGATNVIPAHIALAPLAKVPGGEAFFDKLMQSKFWQSFGAGGQHVIGTSLAVGIQQAATKLASNLTARDFAGYDPNRNPWTGVADALEGGIGAGALMAHLVHAVAPKQPTAAAEPAVEPPAEPTAEPGKALTPTEPKGPTSADYMQLANKLADHDLMFLKAARESTKDEFRAQWNSDIEDTFNRIEGEMQARGYPPDDELANARNDAFHYVDENLNKGQSMADAYWERHHNDVGFPEVYGGIDDPKMHAFISKVLKLDNNIPADIVPPVSQFVGNLQGLLAQLPQKGQVSVDYLKDIAGKIPGKAGDDIRDTLQGFAGRDTADAQEFQSAVQDKLVPFKLHTIPGTTRFLQGLVPRSDDPARAANNFTHVLRAPYLTLPQGFVKNPFATTFLDYHGHANGFYDGPVPYITELRAPFEADPVQGIQNLLRQVMLSHAAKGDNVLRISMPENDPLEKWLADQGATRVRRQGDVARSWMELPLSPELANKAQILADSRGLGYISREHLKDVDVRLGSPPPPEEPPRGGESPERSPPAERPMREELDRFSWGNKVLDSVRMLAYKNRNVADLGPLLHSYLEAVQGWSRTSLGWRYRGSETLNKFRKFNSKDADQVAKFIYDLSEASRKHGRVEPGSSKWAEAAQLYKLNEAQLDFAKRLDGDFQASLHAIKDVWAKEAARLYLPDNQVSYEKALGHIEKTINKIGDQNFVPYSRFGKRAVSVLANDAFVDREGRSWKPGQTVEMRTIEGPFSETRGRVLASSMKTEYKNYPVRVVPHWLTDKSFTWESIPADMRDSIVSTLKLNENQQSALSDLIASMSPAQSFARHLMQRKGTPGFSKDLGRSIADYFTSFSSNIARLEHAGEFRNILKQLHDSGMKLKYEGKDNMKRMQIYEHLMEHHDYLMNPQNELAGLKSLAYLYYLSYLPRTAAIVLSQQPLFIGPHLAALAGGIGKGDAKAVAELSKAYGTMFKRIYMKSARDSNNRFIHPGVIEDDLSTVMQRLEREGVINQAFNSELASASKGSLIDRFMPANPVIKAARSINAFGSYPLALIEKLNRQLTAIAAHRIIREQMEKRLGYKVKSFTEQDKEDLYQQVKEAVLNTNFEYHRWNRPKYMRGPKSALFVFTHFFREALFFQRHMPGRGRGLLALAAMAGLTGLPFTQNLEDLYNAFMNSPLGRKLFGTPPGKYIDIDSDAHELLNQFITRTSAPKALGMSSQQLTELIMHGALHRYALGPTMLLNAFGGNLPDMDMTSAVSEGRLFPGTEFVSGLASHQYPGFGDKLQGAATSTAGVMGGLGQRLAQALVQPNPDTYREIEALTPRVVNTTLKAAKAAHDGMFTDGSGKNLGYVDTKNPAQVSELIASGLTGFQPSRITEAQEVSWKETESAKFFEGQRRMLLANVAQAITDKDPTERSAAMAEIHKFNASAPKGVYIMTPAIVNAVIQAAQKNALKQAGEAPRSAEPTSKAVMPSFQGEQGQSFKTPPG